MNRRHQGHALIDELLTDPAIFRQSGQGYRLLKQYFSDLPIETLRSLINSDNYDVRYVAIGIAEELGEKSSILLDDVICLFDSGDRYAKYNILEIIVVCARGEYQDRFIHLARGLDDSDDVIRTLAMRLMSRADLAQLRAAARQGCSVLR